jgi:hypothetical protein
LFLLFFFPFFSVCGIPEVLGFSNPHASRRGMSNGELENLWVSEKHDTATGKKLFIDMITNVNELSNVLVENISEDTSMYFGGDSINGNGCGVMFLTHPEIF